jgi:hypothetical protein
MDELCFPSYDESVRPRRTLLPLDGDFSHRARPVRNVSTHLKLHHHWPVIREIRLHDQAVDLDARRWQKNEIQRALRQRGRKRRRHFRMQCVVAMAREILEQRGRRVGRVRGIIHVAADDRRHLPMLVPMRMLFREIVHHVLDLFDARRTRAVVQMHVHDRHSLAVHSDLGEEKPFFPEVFAAEFNVLRFSDRMPREDGVAVVQPGETRAAIIHAKHRIGKSGKLAQKIELIEAPRPERILVDLLQRHDIGFEAAQQLRDFQQVRPDLTPRSQPLDGLKTAAVSDVVSDNAQALHVRAAQLPKPAAPQRETPLNAPGHSTPSSAKSRCAVSIIARARLTPCGFPRWTSS